MHDSMKPFRPDVRNANTLWAGVLVETLTRCGVTHAVVSPGSRSTPITMALARQSSLEAIPVLDERSAAFFALGLARQRQLPVALVCTSGTAGANYLPAIIEAQESGVPLLVITADRPPEMRACASGQTIDQQKLFGAYVNFYHELAMPEPGEPLLRYLRQTVLHACTRTVRPHAGPVHLNAPFRDPLAPAADDGTAAAAADGIDWEVFFSHVERVRRDVPGESRVPPLDAGASGLIIVGPEQQPDPGAFVGLVGGIAKKLGWPVITDGLSPLRNHGAELPHVVTTAETLLRNASVAGRLAPEIVICIGGWPTGKVLRGWLEESRPRIVMFSARVDNRDALHGRTQHCAGLAALAEALPATSLASGYEREWAAYEKKARVALDARLAGMDGMFEGKAAWLLAQHLPVETQVFVASSMPVRDVEYFWPPNDRRVRPFCNRGANGIDGTLSTALGLAHQSGRPSVLLTGDLALLHDTNGFLLRPKLKGSLTIVLINNRGGGIFEHLPVAQFEPPFEEFWATPQEADFAVLCAAYGVQHVPVGDWEHFTELVETLPATGIRVLELRTDRKRDAAIRHALFAEIAAGLG
jgi:2-succinyl-5-enolpyruvyl-6-hydroxy-3-cyclohexene-1-carboxylate synthase